MNKITEKLSTVFTEKQINLLKDAWRYGSWGDAEVNFNGEEVWGLGACTNDAKNGKRFNGRQVSGIMSGIAKRIRETGTNMIKSCPDWWGDGTGDMVFFNTAVLCADATVDGKEWEMLNEWSKSNE